MGTVARLPVAAFAVMLLAMLVAGTGAVEAAPGSVLLVGGGRENWYPGSWSEAPCRWFLQRAGEGRIVIVSSVPRDDRLPEYLHELGGVAENLLIERPWLADADEVVEKLSTAAGIILAEDDPWRMHVILRTSKAEAIIREAWENGKPLCGWGGGAALLGEIMIASGPKTLDPAEVIRDPYCAGSGFCAGILATASSAIIEPHFTRRGRLLRLLPMLARYEVENPERSMLGIGIDTQTALLVNDLGHATVSGEGTVTFLWRLASSATRLESGLPPVVTHVQHDQLTDGFVYNVFTREIVVKPESAHTPPALEPVPDSFGYANLEGTRPEGAGAGDAEVLNLASHAYALELGLLAEREGRRELPAAIVMNRALADYDLIGNRVGGLFWGMARRAGCTGVLLDAGAAAEVLAPGGLLMPFPMTRQASLLIVDARSLEWRDCSHWRSFPESVGLRQSVALTNLTDHLLATRWNYDIPAGDAVNAPPIPNLR